MKRIDEITEITQCKICSKKLCGFTTNFSNHLHIFAKIQQFIRHVLCKMATKCKNEHLISSYYFLELFHIQTRGLIYSGKVKNDKLGKLKKHVTENFMLIKKQISKCFSFRNNQDIELKFLVFLHFIDTLI